MADDPPRRISTAYLLGLSNKPFKDLPKPPPPNSFRGMLRTPGAAIEWAASDGRRGRLTGRGRSRRLSGLDAAAAATNDQTQGQASTVANAAGPVTDGSQKGGAAKSQSQPEGSKTSADQAYEKTEVKYKKGIPNTRFSEEEDQIIMRMKTDDATWAEILPHMNGKSKKEVTQRFNEIRPDDFFEKKKGNKGDPNARKQNSEGKQKNQKQNDAQQKKKEEGKEEVAGNTLTADDFLFPSLDSDDEDDKKSKASDKRSKKEQTEGGNAPGSDWNSGGGNAQGNDWTAGGDDWTAGGGNAQENDWTAGGDAWNAQGDAWNANADSGNADAGKQSSESGGKKQEKNEKREKSSSKKSGQKDDVTSSWDKDSGKSTRAWNWGSWGNDNTKSKGSRSGGNASGQAPASEKTKKNDGGKGSGDKGSGGGRSDVPWNFAEVTTDKTDAAKDEEFGWGIKFGAAGAVDPPGWGGSNQGKDSKKSNPDKNDKNSEPQDFSNLWPADGSPSKPASKASRDGEKHRSSPRHSNSKESDHKSSHRRHSSSHLPVYRVAPDDTFSQDDLKLIARILQQDASMVWDRLSWRFKDKTGRNLHPDVFEKKITGAKERRH